MENRLGSRVRASQLDTFHATRSLLASRESLGGEEDRKLLARAIRGSGNGGIALEKGFAATASLEDRRALTQDFSITRRDAGTRAERHRVRSVIGRSTSGS